MRKVSSDTKLTRASACPAVSRYTAPSAPNPVTFPTVVVSVLAGGASSAWAPPGPARTADSPSSAATAATLMRVDVCIVSF